MMKPRRLPLGDKNIVGANMTRLRQSKKLKQKELVEQMQLRGVDIDPASLSKLEGQTRSATDREIKAIAEILAVSIDSLFDGE